MVLPRPAVRVAAVLALTVGGCSSAESPAALRTLDQEAFRSVVDTVAAELQAPGAVVLLVTPQGTVTAPFGTTEIGAQTPPAADTHFRIASNTKTMTAALVVLLAQDGKLAFTDPVAKVRPRRAQR